jgi:hypothetical protein
MQPTKTTIRCMPDASQIFVVRGTPCLLRLTATESGHPATYVQKEVVGSTAEMHGNVMVHTNYWGDVAHPGSCTILMSVNKALQINVFLNQGRL